MDGVEVGTPDYLRLLILEIRRTSKEENWE